MASALDQREQLLSGTTSVQKALMKHRENLAAQKTPGLLGQLSSTGALATGGLSLLAALAGEGEAAANLAIGGVTGAADAVTRQQTEKVTAVNKATDDVFKQIARDQERALRLMQINPELFFESLPDNAAAAEALGLTEQMVMKDAWTDIQSKEKLKEDSIAYYNAAMPLADTTEERKSVLVNTFTMRGVAYDDEELDLLARKNLTFDIITERMKHSTSASQELVHKMIEQGADISNQDVLATMYGALDPALTSVEAATSKAAREELTSYKYALETQLLAKQSGLPVAEIRNPANDRYSKAPQMAAWFEIHPEDEIFFGTAEEHMSYIDITSLTTQLGLNAQKAHDADMANLAITDKSTVIPVQDRVFNGLMATVSGVKGMLSMQQGQMSQSAVNMLISSEALGEGITLDQLYANPAMMEDYSARATAKVTQLAEDFDEIVAVPMDSARVEELADRAEELEKKVVKNGKVNTGHKDYPEFSEITSELQTLLMRDSVAAMGIESYVAARASKEGMELDATIVAQRAAPSSARVIQNQFDVDTYEGLPELKGAFIGQLDKAAQEKAKVANRNYRNQLMERAAKRDLLSANSFSTLSPQAMKEELLTRKIELLGNVNRSAREWDEAKYAREAEKSYDAAVEAAGKKPLPADIPGQMLAIARELGIKIQS